jgi:hypothetical protein
VEQDFGRVEHPDSVVVPGLVTGNADVVRREPELATEASEGVDVDAKVVRNGLVVPRLFVMGDKVVEGDEHVAYGSLSVA